MNSDNPSKISKEDVYNIVLSASDLLDAYVAQHARRKCHKVLTAYDLLNELLDKLDGMSGTFSEDET